MLKKIADVRIDRRPERCVSVYIEKKRLNRLFPDDIEAIMEACDKEIEKTQAGIERLDARMELLQKRKMLLEWAVAMFNSMEMERE